MSQFNINANVCQITLNKPSKSNKSLWTYIILYKYGQQACTGCVCNEFYLKEILSNVQEFLVIFIYLFYKVCGQTKRGDQGIQTGKQSFQKAHFLEPTMGPKLDFFNFGFVIKNKSTLKY